MSDQGSKSNPNRRRFSRVPFPCTISFTTGSGEVHEGEFSNISLKGLLFQCEGDLAVGEKVSGTLDLGEVVLNLTGEIFSTRIAQGYIVIFKDLDVETFSHLRQLVAVNLGDQETVDKEFHASL